ncbi:ATP-dependent OLD family endonuclease [Actinobacillus minor 202]|uniref:ATP-dependent OLD family endonuclease n=1 Tax=Actinobacillus minor 202 TaxID=591023 RepID=A0ABM9YUA0_9PAST|nr:AAA family ATPase [Actinobacillus minor]EEV24882.1 ATP-dependent OLD family endonuclease [Actinobacillus minor 202]
MKIQSIEIKNWRSIKELKIAAQDLMIIIGQNNHGKSNLLSAILFFFGEIKHHDLDFSQGSQELFVELEFTDLDEQDKTTFEKYLTQQETIRVRKTAYLNGSFEYKGWIQICSEDYLKEENAGSYTNRETANSLPFHPHLPTTGRLTKQHIIDAQQKYIQENFTNLSFSYELETTNFMGAKSVAKGIFGDVYFLPAIKNAADDFSSKDTSIFGKLLGEVVETMSQYNSDWQGTKQQLTNLFSKFSKYIDGKENANRPEQLSNLENELSKELSSWNAYFDIELNAPDIDTILKSNASVWINDGTRTDIARKGHGLQRAVTIALIQLIAKRQLQAINNTETTTRVASKSRYFIFEEPELYLHPQAQRALFDSFVHLSETGSQVILCTHSSNLISMDKYKSIYIVKKENEQAGSKVTQCQEDLFDGNQKNEWNLSYWINPDRGELFFAEKVILVEGQTDKVIIPALADRLGVFKYSYTIIDCGSKQNIPLYIKLLNKFSIPYIAVYDKDHQEHKKTNSQAIGAADSATKAILDEVVEGLGITVELVNDIEEELGYESGKSGKPFQALQHIKSDSFQLSGSFSEKIRIIYK